MLEQVDPQTLGFSPQRLKRVSSWLQDQIDDDRLAGASVMIGRRGKIALFDAVGEADKDAALAFSADTIVRIYSMTKAVTTVAAMMLYERGAFQLDDRVAQYLPEFARTLVWTGGAIDSVEPQQTQMSIRHLMTHTSGLTYGFMHTNVVDEAYREANIELPGSSSTLEELVNKVAKMPLICQPGSQWNYSVSTDVLGRLVEVWSGQTLEEFFQSEIIQPLGMHNTGFYVGADKQQYFASLYAPLSGGDMSSMGKASLTDAPALRGGLKLEEAAKGSRFLKPPGHCSGGGGLTSTIGDYARFCQMLLNKGELEGVRLLGRKTVEYMGKNHLPGNRDMAVMGQPVWSETSYDGIGFGLGFAVVIDPVKAHIVTSVGEYHWGGAASTFFWIDPEEALFVVFLTQLIPSSTYPIRRELRARVYQALVD
ncbi:MAG: beta-lactamase family protein [Gammaproteobacteria bacterium]|nr:beta-lactamase family protein [Gammaproteobacteria bacterium]